LETPQEFEDFNYKNYLAKDGIYSVMGFPKIEIIAKQKADIGQWFYKKILWLKQETRQSIQYSFNPPESSILEGTILGDNAAMSDELKNNLNTTGLRHIIAVSGTHVVILSSIIMSLLLILGLKRGSAFYFAVVIICFYIIFTGLSASGVRAGIMGFLYLLAQKLGRQSLGVRVVAIAAAVMLAQNPLLLAFDVGFNFLFWPFWDLYF
jgi:competence protein ComEC